MQKQGSMRLGRFSRILFAVLLFGLSVLFSGCGGGGSSSKASSESSSYSISGMVSGDVKQGVTITLSGAGSGITVTGATGNYSFSNLANGSYTVEPSITGYTFNPVSQAVTVNGANSTAVDFTAAANAGATYSISGTITKNGGGALSSVTITLSGAGSGTATTDASGNYSFSGLANGSYTITPSLSDYTLSPPNSPQIVNGANITSVNFTATASTTGSAIVTTLAGSGSQGYADGIGADALFSLPYSVAVDIAGNVYVADTYNDTIRKITPESVVTTLAGLVGTKGSVDGTGTAASFDEPFGVAVDSAGNVYVADTWNNTIRKITPAGVVTTLAGTAGLAGNSDGIGIVAQFSWPTGLTVDSTGDVYVADTWNNTIRKITSAGVVTTLAGGIKGSADGTGAAANFDEPYGVAVDNDGNVYVADTWNSTIRKITPAGVVSTMAGLALATGSADGTGSDARFNYPRGVAVDRAGNVYVADTWNHTIRKITPGGVVTTLAGTAGLPGSYNGSGTIAQFSWPTGVTVDSAGNVYVADSGNNEIRKITQ